MADDRAVEDLIETRCEVCGTQLDAREIEASQEAGRPFLCSVHAAEVEPAEVVDGEPPDAA